MVSEYNYVEPQVAPDQSLWFSGRRRYASESMPNETVAFNATLTYAETPEPATLALLGTGLIALGIRRRAKKI